MLAASSLLAADIEEPKIPSRFTCAVVRSLYKQYAKHYSQADMEAYLRSKGINEGRIERAKLCLVT